MKSAERSLILIVPHYYETEELTGMSDKITSKEPEHVSCDICMKEVPIDEANSFETVDYVVHFCGLECFEKWKKKKQSAQIGDDFVNLYPGPLRSRNR